VQGGGIALLAGSFEGITREQAGALLAGCSEVYAKLADHVCLFNERPASFDFAAFLSAFESIVMPNGVV
jgi:hypothetical protein